MQIFSLNINTAIMLELVLKCNNIMLLCKHCLHDFVLFLL